MSHESAARTVETDSLNEADELKPFQYVLPSERIADRPCYPFHEARLLNIDRKTGYLEHSEFSYLPLSLGQDDVLILNNTRVMKARLFGNLEVSGASVEVLLLSEIEGGRWKAMGRPLKKFKPGTWIRFSNGVRAQVEERIGEYEVQLRFVSGEDDAPSTSERVLHAGTMPIPPYIRGGRGDEQDELDYQTPYAKHVGSVAAPTAGLHFTDELLFVLRRRGVTIVEVTLHVGAASFLSVWHESEVGTVSFSPPGTEKGRVEPEVVQQLADLRLQGKRLIAVGTTVVRLLETVFDDKWNSVDGTVATDLFIKPGYTFKGVDAMITNFHQPGSSHLLLVEAFMGSELLQKSYAEALKRGYRFLSYGDGMFIE